VIVPADSKRNRPFQIACDSEAKSPRFDLVLNLTTAKGARRSADRNWESVKYPEAPEGNGYFGMPHN
jgi:hypothetical protein